MVAQSNQPVEVNDAPGKNETGGDSLSATVVKDIDLTDMQNLNKPTGGDELHAVELSGNDREVPPDSKIDPNVEIQNPAYRRPEGQPEATEEGDKGGDKGDSAKEGFSRAVENEDGSRVEFTKLPGGKEVVSTIVHPSGDKTVYSGHDADGNPSKIIDTNKEGIQTASAERTGKHTWNMTNKAINNGAPFKAAGELTVGEDGSHSFKDLINGNEFVRTADGSMTMKTAQGIQEIKGPDAIAREKADTDKPIDGVAEMAEAQSEESPVGASDVSRSVENPDGSRIEYSKLQNGEEVVSTVVHPSGEKTVYGNHDADGNPTNVKDFAKNGKQIGESNYDGKVWTTQHAALNGGAPFRQVGELSVDESGTHSFKDSLTDTTFIREADGKISVTDAGGNNKVLKAADKIERSPEATDVNSGVPAENVRMIENADGSKIEMTKLANGNEVVTEVHYPTGEFARFSGHDDSGQPTRSEEYDSRGVRTGHSTREGDEWTVTSQKHNDGNPYKLPGKFEVTGDGKQIFTHPQDGRKLVRLPNGKTEQMAPESTE